MADAAVRPRQRHGVELPQLEGPVGYDAPETLTALGDAHAVAGRNPTGDPDPPAHADATRARYQAGVAHFGGAVKNAGSRFDGLFLSHEGHDTFLRGRGRNHAMKAPQWARLALGE